MLAHFPDGSIDPDASEAMLAASLAPDRGGKSGRPSDDGAPASFNEVRTARERYNAKLAELEYRRKVGELVEWERIEQALAEALGPILARLDAQSSRLAALVAPEGDVRRCTELIDADVRSIRQDLADTFRSMLAVRGQTKQ